MTDELPPRLLAVLKKLDQEVEPLQKEVEAAPGVHPARARRIAANIAKLPELAMSKYPFTSASRVMRSRHRDELL